MTETEMNNLKVYELAKELQIDSLSLLDRLKKMNINVKNHMSELSAEQVKIAKDAMVQSEEEKASTSGAKSTGRRKIVQKRTSSSANTASASTSTTPAKKKTAPVRKKKAASDDDKKSAASTMLIRRTKRSTANTSEDGEEIQEAVAIKKVLGETDSEAEESIRKQQDEMDAMTHQEDADEFMTSDPLEENSTGLVYSSDASAPTNFSNATSSQVKAAAAPEVEIKKPPKKSEPKRSITGILKKVSVSSTPKSGLKILEVPKDEPKLDRTPSHPAMIKVTKEKIDLMVEEERKKKRPGSVKSEAPKPEDQNFADFRKKEMVFLPKKKKVPVGKALKKNVITQKSAHKRVVEMDETISVQDLAGQLEVKAPQVIKKLMGLGQMANINSVIDFDTASLVASEFQHEVKSISFEEEKFFDRPTEEATSETITRPPVVTVMGHVDHGKTSLLDAIRSSDVASGEHGGITQHIGASTIQHNGHQVSFIDTPGHEAFSEMRSRGANVTDIVVLVVAADDGVMPQTREAISHSKAAGVPIIVAINKIDKPQANPDKAKKALAELDLLPEDWGGEIQMVPVSAVAKTNIDKLLDAILLQAEILELKADPTLRASGIVLESKVEKGKGPVATVLIKQGTLKVGDSFVSGQTMGRVKAIQNEHGERLKELGPGLAGELLGLENLPNAGNDFEVVKTEAEAKKVHEYRVNQQKKKAQLDAKPNMTLESIFSKIQTGNMKELNIILKADVFGSTEAVRDSLQKLSTDQVAVKILHSAPGGITESDVNLAQASQALIIGFNVRPETKARQLAESIGVQINCYNIIYELIDDVKNAMRGMLDKKQVEKYLGRAEVRQTFTVPKLGMIAGCAVIDGKVVRGANVRLLRDSRVIFEGKMSSLRRFKDDAKEVQTGYECGIGFENYNDLKPQDIIEAYEIEMVAPDLQF